MARYLLSLLAVLGLFPQILRCETVKGDDSRITYIGRTLSADGKVSFDWTGVYLKVRFQGSSLAFNVSDTKKNYSTVTVSKCRICFP